MKLSHLNGLRALEATLRNGTFTAAAKELGVTVAAIGQQIRGLEEFLGLKLFDRLPSGVRPTREATEIAARLTSGFSQVFEVLDELRGLRRDQRVTVSMSHFILENWLSAILPGFHKNAPDAEIRFDTGEDYANLFDGSVDMAIRFSPKPGPEFAFESLFKGCFLPVCTPEFAAQHGLSPNCPDLTGVPLYRLHDTTSDPAWVGWPELLRMFSIRKDDSPVQRDAGHRVAVVGEGLMLTGLTECHVDLKNGRLVAPLGPDFVRHYTFGYRLVWPAGKTLTRPMKQFHNWLLAEKDIMLADASRVLGVELR